MPLPIIGALAAFLTGWFARFVGASLLRFIALKLVLFTLCATVLPIVLYNIISFIGSELLDLISTLNQGSGLQSFILELTGFGGWFAKTLKLPEAFTAVMSAAILRFTFNLIPFVGKA